MSRRRKLVIIVAASLVCGVLFTAFILPLIVRSQLEKQIKIATDRSCQVAKVYINPLNWSVEAVNVKLAEKKSNAVFVSFSSLRLRISPTSIWRMAPVVSSLKITTPYIHLQRNASNSYNFSDILEKHPPKKNNKPARFSLNNIIIENGRLVFDDNAVANPTRHNVEKINLQVPFISNISYFADRYVDPKFSAVANGAPLNFDGKLKPFDKGLEASLDINLKRVDIPYYAAYFPAELPIRITQGELSGGVRINHQLVRDGKSDIHISGQVALKNLVVTEPTGAPLLALKSAVLDIAKIGLLDRRYELAKLLLESPLVSVSGDKDGTWNLSRLKSRNVTAEEESPEANPGPEIIITSLRLTDGAVNVKDLRPPGGCSVELKDIEISLNNFTNKGKQPAQFSLSLISGRKEKAAASGSLSMEPFALSANIALSDIVLEASYPYLAGFLNAPVKGSADFNGNLVYTKEKGFSFDHSMFRLKGLKIPFGKSDAAFLPLLVVEGGSFSLKEKAVAIEKISVAGGKVDISRDHNGKLSSSLLFKSKGEGTNPRTKAVSEEKPFSWNIGKISLNALKASFLDNMKDAKPRFKFASINVDLSSVSGPKFAYMPVSISATSGPKGKFSIVGRLNPAPFHFSGNITSKSLPFAEFDPYLPEGVNMSLIDGTLDAKLFLDLAIKDGKPSGRFQGEGDVRDFYSVDMEEDDLLKWESLHFDRFSGNIEPFSLTMSGLSLNNYYAKVVINKSGRTNLREIYKKPIKSGDAEPASNETQSMAKSKDLRIDTVTLSGGTLKFSDHHLNRDFSTTMLNVGGRISGLSSATGSTAEVDLRGNLENHSPLKISGRVNPLAKDLFLDMQIDFSDIELSPLTPYSGTYLGYIIDKGKLSLTMKYKVENKILSAENIVFIDQFTFGDKVESNKATSLPVSFAVALLKDKNGEIHLNLPLSGRIDSPKFSIWGLVGQVLKNLLEKAATSPFALLQASFGDGADFSSVSFAPGVSRLTAAEEDKLRLLARVLTERPGLRLEVMGFADRVRDPEGYRKDSLLKKMRNERSLSLTKERADSGLDKSASTDIPEDEQSKWLKIVYEKEKFPRPRTVIGTLKTLPDEEMKKLILANTPVSEQQLRSLARERVLTVINFLVKEGKLSPDRLFEKSTDPFAASGKGAAVGGRVEFGVVAR